MQNYLNRSFFICALLLAASAALGAQQNDQYQGTSNPPPDDTIVTPAPAAPVVLPKPSPAHVMESQPAPAQNQYQAQPLPAPQYGAVRPALSAPEDGTDSGIVQIAPDAAAQPSLSQRAPAADPDGDIVQVAPRAPGEVGEGTTIRVRLLDRLSTAESHSGDLFHTRVASDVLQDGQVLIPAGSEIDGRVMSVSTGSFGGHGSMRLNPDSVILPDGSRYKLYAQVSAALGSNTRVGNEGAINPGSRLKRNSIEYGGGVGAGLVTGAALGGPVGALAGSMVGAGLVTAHLLISHPQAHLEEGTYLVFMLTEPLHLVPTNTAGN